MRSLSLVVVVVAVLSSCAQEGDPCRPSGSAVCSGPNSLLYCPTTSRFDAVQCPGGCSMRPSAGGEIAVCLFTGAKEGDPCPPESYFGAVGFCATSKSLLRCENQVFKAYSCSSCVTDDTGGPNGLPAATCTP